MRIDEKLRVIYETIAPSVTRTENAWKEYLQFGSRIFKHSFDNALLVYAQSPKLTMLATTPIWNKVGRYINKGEKGTAVCEYENAKLTLKYLFDVVQTNGNKTPEVWSLDEEKSKSLSERLAYSYNLDTVDLSDCITQISEQRVFETFDDYMQGFENDIAGHFLSELPREAVTGVIMETIENSVKYFVACRCGITNKEMNVPTISHFDTIPLIARLGHSVTDISKGILTEIERNVKIIENERSNQNEQRNTREQGITRTAERSATGEHDRRRVRAAGQIRQDSDKISARTESPKIFTFEDARAVDGENAQGGQRGEGENRGNNTEIIAPRPIAADGRYNGENAPLQQAEGHSGGDSSERDSVREKIDPQPIIEEISEIESLDSGSFLLPQNIDTINRWQDRITNSDKLFTIPIKESLPTPTKIRYVSDWIKANSSIYLPSYVVMYHSTGRDIPVLEQGLLPTTQNRRRSFQSESGYVYLANTPERAKSFGDLGNMSDSVVYEVIVPVTKLLPDTDQLNNHRAVGNQVGNSLAESICYGGARVKGKIEQWQIKEYVSEQTQQTFQGTPLWQNYQSLTEQYPNTIIFKQLGDFYEVMGKDTKTVSDELSLVPTSRDVGLLERVPLIGIPIHTLDGNIDTLLSRGYDVAIANSDGTVTERKTIEVENTIPDEEKIINQGDHIMLEGRAFSVKSVDVDRNQIKLTDLEFIRRGQVPITRVDDLDYVLKRFKLVKNVEIQTEDKPQASTQQFTLFDTQIENRTEHDIFNEFSAVFTSRVLFEESYLKAREGFADAEKAKTECVNVIDKIAHSLGTDNEEFFNAYSNNADFRNRLINYVFDKTYTDTVKALARIERMSQQKDKPINDLPHRNYRAFNQLFPQIADGTYNYLKLESDGFEPLSVERIGGNQISIMHTFIQNGDLMRDPDMVIEIDTAEQTIHALSYELSSMGLYQEVNVNGYINTKLQKDLNSFLSEWLTNIKNQNYVPIRAVEVTNDEDIDIIFDKEGNIITPITTTPQSENTDKPFRITDESLDAHNGQIDMFLQAYVGDERVGYIQYSIYEDTPNLSYIEVEENHRRQGYGTKMLQYLAKQFPDAEISWGYTTNDGMAFKQAITYSVENEEYTNAKNRISEIDAQLAKNDLDFDDGKVFNDGEYDDWNNLHDEKRELEDVIHELNPTKTFVKLDSVAVSTPKAIPEMPNQPSKINYHYSDSDNLYIGGAKTKYKANIEAIRLLKRLESDKRLATPDEQKVLANYVGWGGIANAFSSTASGWENEYQELKHLLDEDEYKAAMNSTITAYYTEPKLIEYMYKALDNFGFAGGEGRKILDPAMGTGNFFSALPKVLEDVKLCGVELDSITGRLAKQLYQKADISVQGFETTRFEDNSFDIAIGNIPFNNIKVFDRRYAEQDFLIHDYFLAKSLDLVKPGGIIAYITTKGTMDKKDTTVRAYIAQRADLIGAIRLPNTAFKALAGTEVTADILFFQKLPQMRNVDKFQLPDWVYTHRRPDYMVLNQYFIDNPEMILGEMQFSRNMYGREDGTACIPPENQDLYAELGRAINNLSATFTAEPDVIKQSVDDELDLPDETGRIKADEGTKNSIYVVKNDEIYFCNNGYLEKQDIKGKKAERIKGLCEIKTALQAVIAVQSREYQSDELETAQKTLNEVYDGFVKKNGYINDKPNIAAFSDDDQFPLLRSIEDENKEKTAYTKAPIFTRATIKSYKQPTYAESAKEALEISLNVKMKVDLNYMADLYEKSGDDIIAELGDRIYLNPQKYYGNPHEGWETNEEYLSGNVADKLAYAMLKADDNELFIRNVEALRAVQPPKLMPSDIDFRIGSPWIPLEYFKQFMYETFGTQSYYQNGAIDLDYLEFTTTWRVSGKNSDNSIKVNQTYGTGRMNAYEIYEDCLNLQSTTVRDRVDYTDNNGKDQVKYVVNAAETMIARSKQQQIKEAFSSWLFSDSDRAEILLNIYNEKFNTIRPREYNGSHLVFPNMNEEKELRPHQQDVAARIIYNGTCLMAHEVGAGKTAAMIAAGIYMKNIGAIKKPIYVVPNHLCDQWATEFYRFFPTANLLVTSKKDFDKHNRKKFVSKIAMGSYDAVIIGHSQFERIPISKERQEKQLNEEISYLTLVIMKMKEEKGENWAIKQIVIFQNNLKNRLEKLLKEERKDDLLTFEQLGVDYMFVDEAHVFKNCFTYSKMRNIAGIGKSSSQRASDMLLKCQYLQEINQGKGVTFATGTPISNSMSEMFVMQRYLQPNLLKKLGLHYFDSWAATFGEVTSSLEITPEGSGYRMKNRFSKFHNLPELMNIFRLVADIQTADMLKLPVPELEGGKANIIVTQCSEFQKQIMNEFVLRADAIRKREVDASIDNMLKLTNEAKLMAIDPRLVYADAPNDPDSKLNTCIKNVYDKWVETSENKLTQIIFCDSGTPKPGQFNVYDETKSELIKMGVPANEIAFVHDAKTDAQRDDMFEKVRTGVIRVILGSTSKLGTGTNIQDLLVAEHDLDVPWRPSDITQRSGRILRQGNNNPLVSINRYVTKGTFDSYLWQIQEQKLRYITQVMTGKSISRSCEDADETVLSAAEVKAIATSNPLLAEKMEVDNEVTRLKLLKGNWNNERLVLVRSIENAYPTTIKVCEESIDKIKADIVTEQKTAGQEFSIIIDGKSYTERAKAGETFVTVMRAKCEVGEGAVTLGEYRGFELRGIRKNLVDAEIRLCGENMYKTDIGDSALGCITRIENLIGRLPNILSDTEQTLAKARAEFEEAKIAVIKPFEFEERLNEYVAKQSEINTKLEFKELSKQEETILDEKNDEEEKNEDCENESEDEEYDNDSVYATYGVEA